MIKQITYYITRLGEKLAIKEAARSAAIQKPPNMGPFIEPIHGEDFMPELKQQFYIDDFSCEFYVSDAQRYRQYIPFRKNQIETNTQYMGNIIEVLSHFVELETNGVKRDLTEVSIDEIKESLDDILHLLSTRIFVKESKYRYQFEQAERYKQSLIKFDSKLYFLTRRTLYNFIEDYNNFIYKVAKNSTDNTDRKIPYNIIGDYHTEVAAFDKFVTYLKFRESKICNFASEVLAATYTAPKNQFRI